MPDRANALDGWLNLLADRSPHSSVVGIGSRPGELTPEEDTKVEYLWLASADYCVVLATMALELTVAAKTRNRPRLRRDQYPLSSSSWLYDHDHGGIPDPRKERDYWKTHVLRKQEAGLQESASLYLALRFEREEAVMLFRRDINSAVLCLSYDLAVLQGNCVIDAGLHGKAAIRAFHAGSTELLEELSSFRAVGSRMTMQWEDGAEKASVEKVPDPARSFHLVEGDLRLLLGQPMVPTAKPQLPRGRKKGVCQIVGESVRKARGELSQQVFSRACKISLDSLQRIEGEIAVSSRIGNRVINFCQKHKGVDVQKRLPQETAET